MNREVAGGANGLLGLKLEQFFFCLADLGLFVLRGPFDPRLEMGGVSNTYFTAES